LLSGVYAGVIFSILSKLCRFLIAAILALRPDKTKSKVETTSMIQAAILSLLSFAHLNDVDKTLHVGLLCTKTRPI
jgi:hypothetical protein